MRDGSTVQLPMAKATKAAQSNGNGQRIIRSGVGDDEQAPGKRSCFFRSRKDWVDALSLDGCHGVGALTGRCLEYARE